MGKSAADAGEGRRVRCKPDNGGGTGITRTQSQMWPVVSLPLKGKCGPAVSAPSPTHTQHPSMYSQVSTIAHPTITTLPQA